MKVEIWLVVANNESHYISHTGIK